MRGASTVLGGVCADLSQKCGKAALSYSTPISYANLNSSYWQSHLYAYGRLP